MKKYIQEEICESRGREARYQVWALNEDGKPAKYHDTDDSPVNKYALIDRINGGYDILETVDAPSYTEASEILMSYVEGEVW